MTGLAAFASSIRNGSRTGITFQESFWNSFKGVGEITD